MRNCRIEVSAAILILSAAFLFAQDKKSFKQEYTATEVQKIYDYFSAGKISTLADSATVATNAGLRDKFQALFRVPVAKRDSVIKRFTLTANEKLLVQTFMQDDARAATVILTLWQKLAPVVAVRDTTKTLAKK
ncbi:MAG: hypothetical protein IT440_15555 [Phycisphaeraceae bacterium]|nr:hypothetical protein [Phycisphaeraceae bacterium]